MTTPKSRNERIRRKLRKPNMNVGDKDMSGRITVKKSSNNDPERKNKYSRKISEEFLEFYKTGDSDSPVKFKDILEHLKSISIENAGTVDLPYSLSRIEELSTIINEDINKMDEDSNETRSYEITGKIRHLNQLEQLFKIITSLSNWGSSRSVIVHIDGDGSSNLVIKVDGNDDALAYDEKSIKDDGFNLDDESSLNIGIE